MILNSLVTQLVMLGISFAIVFTYVQPTFSHIGETQNAIEQYKGEYEKVDEVNNKLQSLLSRVNSLSVEDQKALLTYLPEELDHVAVLRDVSLIAKRAKIELRSLTYNGISKAAVLPEEVGKKPVKHDFGVTVKGSYPEIKDFLGLLEQNNYPLEAHELKLTSDEVGLMNLDLTLVTYSRL